MLELSSRLHALTFAITLWVFLCATAQAQNSIPEAGAKQIRALLAEKATRNAAQLKLDSQIHYAAKAKRGLPIADGVSTLPFVLASLELDKAGRVHVDIKANVSPDVLRAITSLGGTVENSFPRFNAIRAWLPLLEAETLAGRTDVLFIAPAALGRGSSGPDLNGVRAHAADVVQSQGYDGSGVTIGILSDGVDSLASEQAAGRLPPAVSIIPGQQGSGDEGTAMLEILYSVAPGAQLYFASAKGSDAQMASNIEALQAAGCTIIVDDWTYFDEPVFQDGPIAQAVNDVVSLGVTYFSDAQNSGNLDSGTSGTWEGDFVNSNTTLGSLPELGTIHSFGSANNDTVTVASQNGYYLNWSDASGASNNDYDLFLMDATLTTVIAPSTTIQNGTQNPYEHIEVLGQPGDRLIIVNYLGQAAPRALHLDTERAQLSISTDGATFGHNAASTAITVAAASVASANGGAFTGGTSNPPEKFSSDGPRQIFYNQDGSPITPNNYLFGTGGGTTLLKVDLTAADQVTTGIAEFNPFSGTSAAAPHAAAIAALLKSADSTLTPAQIRSALTSTALRVTGFGSRTVGSGIVMADRSISSVVTPIILSISPGTVYVNQNTTLTVTGSNFQNGFTAFVVTPLGTFPISGTALTFVSSQEVQAQVDLGGTNGYTATLTINNPGGQSASGTIEVVGGIPISGTLTGSATWSQLGIPYIIGNNGLTVPAGATLTIAPGVVVKFMTTATGHAYLDVQGTLVANGTATQGIVFTSYLDDTADGDTNGDGGATVPSPGDWTAIRFDNGAKGSLSYATVRYGGFSTNIYGTFSLAALDVGSGSATPTLSNCQITNNLTGMAVDGTGTSVTIAGFTFQANTTGLLVSSGAASVTGTKFSANGVGASVTGGTGNVTGDTFTNNTTTAISTGAGAKGTIQSNAITTTTGASAFSISTGFLGTISKNTATGSGINGIDVSGTLTTGSATWSQQGIAYVIGNNGATVSAGATLTIAPGVVVKFMTTATGHAYLDVQGTLVANGTATQGIVFTSYLDDTADGDTNGDGGATVPSPGDWTAIRFDNGAKGSLSYATVRYGGFSTNIYGTFSLAALDVGSGSATPTLSNCQITNNLTGMAVDGTGTSVTIAGFTFQANTTGLLVSSGAASVTGTKFSANGVGASVTGGTGNVTGDTFTNNTTTAISTGAGAKGTIQSNAITTTTGASAFSISTGFLGTISKNTATGSGINGIDVSGTLTTGSATWSQQGIAYVIGNNGATVSAGATLTIAPGVVVKFMTTATGHAYLDVQGTLVANGTATQGIVFTSYLDDTADGDTNGDGGATVPSPGDWTAIRFDNGAKGSLSYATVRYGGFSTNIYGTFSLAALDVGSGSATPTLSNCQITNNLTGMAVDGTGTSVTIAGFTFQANTTGLLVSSGAASVTGTKFSANGVGASVTGGTGNVTGDTFTNNTTTAISTGAGAKGTIQSNAITTTTGASAFSISTGFLGTISKNTATGSGINGIDVSGTLTTGSATWSQQGIAYVIGNNGATVSAGATLTIAPGVVVKFMTTATGHAYLDVQGTLVANGTATQGIVFTSYLDDTADGDTNGDGGATVPSPGDWTAIRFDNGAKGSLSYATVRYGGFSTNIYGTFSLAALDVGSGSATPTLSNCQITNNLTGMAVDGTGTSVTIAGFTFQANTTGLLVSSGAASVTGTKFSANGVGASVTGGTGNVTGDTFTNNTTTAISTGAGAKGTIQSNAITTTTGASAFSISTGFLGTISKNTATGSGINGIDVSGTLTTGSATWSQQGIAYVIGNNGATVSAGATLTIAPGVVVKFMTTATGHAYLDVQGTLVANGTATQGIVFTSYLDDTADGDTNGDGGATVPSPGDWTAIRFDNGAKGSLSYATVRYGGFSTNIYGTFSLAALDVGSGSATPTLSNCQITNNLTGMAVDGTGTSVTIAGFTFQANTTGVAVSGDANPKINNNTVSGNAAGLTNSDSALLIDATKNYWGSPSGPSGAGPGSGDSVSKYVTYVPFLSAPPAN